MGNIHSLFRAFIQANQVLDVERMLEHTPSLLEDELDKKNVGRDALSYACEYGHSEIVKLLLKRGSKGALSSSQSGFLPLHYAAINGHLKVIQRLLRSNVHQQLFHRDQNGNTPLWHAVKNKRTDCFEILIQSNWELLYLDEKSTIFHLKIQPRVIEKLCEIVGSENIDPGMKKRSLMQVTFKEFFGIIQYPRIYNYNYHRIEEIFLAYHLIFPEGLSIIDPSHIICRWKEVRARELSRMSLVLCKFLVGSHQAFPVDMADEVLAAVRSQDVEWFQSAYQIGIKAWGQDWLHPFLMRHFIDEKGYENRLLLGAAIIEPTAGIFEPILGLYCQIATTPFLKGQIYAFARTKKRQLTLVHHTARSAIGQSQLSLVTAALEFINRIAGREAISDILQNPDDRDTMLISYGLEGESADLLEFLIWLEGDFDPTVLVDLDPSSLPTATSSPRS